MFQVYVKLSFSAHTTAQLLISISAGEYRIPSHLLRSSKDSELRLFFSDTACLRLS